MRIDILTLFPEIFDGVFQHSILKRSQDKKIVEIYLHNIRDYSLDKHKKVDDYAYGGGPGMVMAVEPISQCIEALIAKRDYDEIIYMAPDGIPFKQDVANGLSLKENLMFLCGHYKGIDERIRQYYITQELSLGDFVLSGGELAAATMIDAIVRVIPGVLNDETSALSDSFQDGLLSAPVYTRPPQWKGLNVPEVLLSGNDKLIAEWKIEQQIQRTKERRMDLLK